MSKRKLQQSPNASYDRFRTLFEQSLDAIYIVATDGASIEANQAWHDLFGYTREDLATLKAADIYADPADRADFLRRIADTGFVKDEVRFKRKDGTVFDSERTVVTVKDGSGNVNAYQGIIHDITGRKRAEDALRDSEEKFRALFEQSLDAIYVGTPDGRVVDVNQAWLDLFGYDRADLPRLRSVDFYADPADREDFVRRMSRDGFVKDEVVYKRKDGSRFLCQRYQTARRDASGRVISFHGINRDISALAAAEDALHASEQRFRSLFEQSMDGISIAATDGTSLEANQAWLDLFGYTRDDLASLNAVDVYAEPGVRDSFLKRVNEMGFARDEVRFRRKDGTVFDCERSVMALRDQSGALLGYQAVNRDITERERARSELLQSESKYRALFEHSMDAISLVSPGGLLLDANQTYLDLFGYSKEDIGVANVEGQYVEPSDRTRMLECIVDHDDLVDDPVRLRKRDGAVMDCLRTVVARRDADGAVIGDQSVIRDITAQKKAEEALRRSEAFNRSIVEVIPDIIIKVNAKGEMLDIIASSDDQLAVSRSEAAGKSIVDILSTEDAPRAAKAIEEALRTNSLQTMEYQLEMPSGTRWFEARFQPSRHDEIVALIRDITERKRAEQAVHESEERFSQLAEQSRTWAWEVDFEGLYTYVDRVAEQVIGYHPEELVGKKYFYDLHPETRREEFKTAGLHIVQSGGELAHFENPVVSKDGRTLWFSTSGIPLLGDDGHVLGYRGWDVDITAQRQVALALGESEARFRSLFEQSWDAIYVGTPEGTIIDVNQSWLDLFGYSRDELSRITVLDLYADPSDRSQFLRRITAEGRVQDEVRYKKKDGTVFDCERTVVVRTDAQGRAIAYQGIFRDVSQRNRDRAELERLARFDSLTGILNRRLILERVDEWIVHVRRYKGHLSVVMLDIDHFKQVNDRYGHQVGDRVLADTAHLLQRSLRQTDFAGRYGGEEFLLVLPQTDAAGAAVIAERARVILQGTAMHDAEGGTYGVTASFGVAEWSARNDVDALVGRADAAMYRAKELGRNRVEVAPFPEHAPPEK
jgi:diguanylate cyclase (GGDEF)-like protein/PAS domain S-box-containing protein